MCVCVFHWRLLALSLQEHRERQKQHEKMYKPASKHQLEEVWEEDDGLKDEQFDPKTFFFLHGQFDTTPLALLIHSTTQHSYSSSLSTDDQVSPIVLCVFYAVF